MNEITDALNAIITRFREWKNDQTAPTLPGGGEVVGVDADPGDSDEFAADLARLIFETPIRVTSVPSTRIVTGRHTGRHDELAAAVVGFQPDRLRIRLRNMSNTGNTAYVGFDGPTSSPATGFPVADGTTLELETQAPIYVRSLDSTETVQVAYLIEFGD